MPFVLANLISLPYFLPRLIEFDPVVLEKISKAM